jgi:hypothetical protein
MVLAGCGGDDGTGGTGGTGDDTTGATDTDAGSGSSTTGSISSATGSDAGSGSDGSTTSGGSSGSSSGGAFEPWAHTLLDGGRLAMETNVPRNVDTCLADLPADAPCEDADLDGLVDVWEIFALELLRPMLRLDEAESLVDDPDTVLAFVGRVAPAAANPDQTRMFVMLGYHRDYGSCGFTAHNGDSERVALDLGPLAGGGPGDVVMTGAYTAAHEGTATDGSRLFVGSELDQLVIEPDPDSTDPRWVVFPSADKHATYATIDICENVSPLPCFDEDCAPDGVASPADYDRLPPVWNAGEESAPMLEALDAVGFPGDDAWADQEFCGGLGGSGCSSAVREKLLVDPFV